MSPITQRRITRTIIPFVDDAYFFVCGRFTLIRMQELIQKYNKLHSASGEKGHFEKNNFWFWRTDYDDVGYLKYFRLPDTISVDYITINSLPLSTPVKFLGVISSLLNIWDLQFDKMVLKMNDEIRWVIKTALHPHEVHIYFHAYMIKSVFYGAGVYLITEEQECQLCKIYEGLLLRKLGYSEKFPRALLYVYINAMGLGFMKPRTIADQLRVKLLVGHERFQTETNELIETLHEFLQFFSGMSQNIVSLPRQY